MAIKLNTPILSVQRFRTMFPYIFVFQLIREERTMHSSSCINSITKEDKLNVLRKSVFYRFIVDERTDFFVSKMFNIYVKYR